VVAIAAADRSLVDHGQFDGEWKKKHRVTSCLKAGAGSAMGARSDAAHATGCMSGCMSTFMSSLTLNPKP